MARRRTPPRELPLIGWREWLALPELGVPFIKAKIDTGARTSSLHALHVETFERDQQTWVRFDVHPLQRDARVTVSSEAPVREFRDVRSSSGHVSRRPVIITPAILLGQRFDLELTLANRVAMGFRMLLGREAVRGRFLIDTSHSFLSERPPRSPRSSRPR